PAPGEIERFLTLLPIAVADELVLECRLGGRRRPVDVLVRLSSPPDDLSPPLFEPVRVFMQRWRDAPLPLRDIWIELDRDAPGASPTLPRLLLLLNLFFGPRGGLHAPDAGALGPQVREALRALLDDTRAREAEAGLFACVAALP